eukprot:scaffold23370_cov52-Prasinocladus_malaysianus.AAC.2
MTSGGLCCAEPPPSAYQPGSCPVLTRLQRLLLQICRSDLHKGKQPPVISPRLKMEVLTAIADTNTAYEICMELSEYVNYGDNAIAKEAVRCVGKIALEVPDVPGICDRLLSFLDMNKPHVAAETLVIVKVSDAESTVSWDRARAKGLKSRLVGDLLRRYPERADECIAAVSGVTPLDIADSEARAAYVWLLGEHGKSIQDAPYLLEALAEVFSEQTSFVQLSLLTACMKLFFQRPPECQRLLGSVLKAGTSDVEQVSNKHFHLGYAKRTSTELLASMWLSPLYDIFLAPMPTGCP